MQTTSILTGDVVGSKRRQTDSWLEPLRQLLSRHGKSPAAWEIYRGDEFQIEIPDPAGALIAAFEIRALMRSLKLDARISIGLGEKDYIGRTVTESNGSAFVHSGELFEKLKSQKTTLGLNSGRPSFDEPLNLMLRLATPIVSGWLPQQAAYVLEAIRHPELSQEELGQRLDINQAAVSGRRKRAQFELLLDLDAYYRNRVKTTFP